LTERFVVRPGTGIGPIDIGMSRSSAIAAAIADGLTVVDFRRGPGLGKPDLFIGSQLFAYFDVDGAVEEVEVAVPTTSREIAVECLGMDLSASYEAVRNQMSGLGHVDAASRDPGTSAYAELGLVLWADAGLDDYEDVRVEAILVRRSASEAG
jgi:hypothetical protein